MTNQPHPNSKGAGDKIKSWLKQFFRRAGNAIQLNDRNWKWMGFGALSFLLVFAFGTMFQYRDSLGLIMQLLVAIVVYLSLPLLIGGLAQLGIIVIKKMPRKVPWLLYSAIGVVVIYSFAPNLGVVVQVFYLVFTPVFLFGAFSNFVPGIWEQLTRPKRLLTIFFFTMGAVNLILVVTLLVYPGPKEPPNLSHAIEAKNSPLPLDLPDPSYPGPYEVAYFTYGSGNDKQRKAFSSEVSLVSCSVDGSNFVDGWEGLPGRMRTAYWGFGPDSLPLNGRVWVPERKEPTPVVLIVHGNHFDRDFSDVGYNFLGEHLASHGYLTISVDENFLNASLGNFMEGLSEENDARGWLLLKHLEFIRSHSALGDTSFLRNADLNNVILIGHSRGGEAVCVASAFNGLKHYPDNAMEEFDFQFGIKGVITIAQVDGQYLPSSVEPPLEGINFLAIQGSMDSDLTSFEGLRQYNRVEIKENSKRFKSAWYIYGANHGQFNSSWGLDDIGFPNGLLLNKRAIMNKTDQEQVALVLFTAFLKSTFNELDYQPIFRDYRRAAPWLPTTLFVNQYEDGQSEIIIDYEEDLDIHTASTAEVHIAYENLSKLYENRIGLKYGANPNKSVVVGWNNAHDTLAGSYGFTLGPSISQALPEFRGFRFDVTVLDEDAGERPKEACGHSESIQQEQEEQAGKVEPDQMDANEQEEDDLEPPVIFDLQFIGANGDTLTVDMESWFPLNRPKPSRLYKLKVFADEPMVENHPQYIEIPFDRIQGDENDVDFAHLQEVRFLFPYGESGVIALDNLGFYR